MIWGGNKFWKLILIQKTSLNQLKLVGKKRIDNFYKTSPKQFDFTPFCSIKRLSLIKVTRSI